MLTAFSAQLSKRRTGRLMSVTSNVYDPLAIDTPGAEAYRARAPPSRRMAIGPHVIIRKVLGWVLSPLLGPIYRYFARKTMRTAFEGADGLVHLATSPHLTRASGKIYALSSTEGLTRAAGCLNKPESECGLAKAPASLPEGMYASELYAATLDALTPWLPPPAHE